ncbi:MAG: TlpA family protein disulfide reductase [Bdellovibrionales bacterium]|nr:TlpA family protein disulfide reductase [Ramlibacter sp.]
MGSRRSFLHHLAFASGAAALLPVRAEQAFEARRWPAGLAAPALEAQDLDGKTWRLGALRGRAVVLNFWASWCEPCRAEMPTLQQLAEVYGPDKLTVLTVNYKENAAKASQFVRTTGMTLPVLLDPVGDLTRAWEVRTFPSTILIAADGKPRLRLRGEVDWSGDEAEKMIAGLLKRV